MVVAKTELFDKDLRDCAGIFRALGHPARLQILKYLAATKTCITGDISGELPLGRTTVNQHLKELKKSGLVIGTVSGKKRNYCLNPEKINVLKNMTSGFISEIISKNNCC